MVGLSGYGQECHQEARQDQSQDAYRHQLRCAAGVPRGSGRVRQLAGTPQHRHRGEAAAVADFTVGALCWQANLRKAASSGSMLHGWRAVRAGSNLPPAVGTPLSTFPMLDDLSDELFDMVITDCGGKSLTVCVPRVAKRWTTAAARALASLRHLDARRTPMRPWPVELASNRIEPGGALYKNKEIQERVDEGARFMGHGNPRQLLKTRAQLLAEPGGEANVQREDTQKKDDMLFYNPPQFRPDAFQWSTYKEPEPLRLVRLSSGELRKATQADFETGIEQRFTRVDEGDSLETLARNLRLMLSKTTRLERLTIDADLWDHPAVTDFGWGEIKHHLLNLSFLPTPIAAQLKELTVYGKMCSQTAEYLAAACHNLEKLAYDTYIEGEQDDGDGMGWGGVEGEHVGWSLGYGGLAALQALKRGCPKLTTIPLISMNETRPRTMSLTKTRVDQVFALLHEWSTLQKVLIHSLPLHKHVLANTMDMASGNRGAFLGKLSVEFGVRDEDQFTLYDQYKAKWPNLVMDSYNDENEHLVDQPQVSVRLHQLRTNE